MIGVAITKITIDEVIQDQITDKMFSALSETEVKVGTEMKITIMNIQEVGLEIDCLSLILPQLYSNSNKKIFQIRYYIFHKKFFAWVFIFNIRFNVIMYQIKN